MRHTRCLILGLLAIGVASPLAAHSSAQTISAKDYVLSNEKLGEGQLKGIRSLACDSQNS